MTVYETFCGRDRRFVRSFRWLWQARLYVWWLRQWVEPAWLMTGGWEVSMDDSECEHCGFGSILPSGRCDHCDLRRNEPGYGRPLTETDTVSIDARVETVYHNEDASGRLGLIDRPGDPPGIAGQKALYYETAPYEVTALNGLNVWGSSSCLMLGDRKIADREGYTRIRFVSDAEFVKAVTEYHRKHYATPSP